MLNRATNSEKVSYYSLILSLSSSIEERGRQVVEQEWTCHLLRPSSSIRVSGKTTYHSTLDTLHDTLQLKFELRAACKV